MIDTKVFEDIAKKITEKLPPNLGNCRAEIENNLKAALQSGFKRMNLVTREEFEVQQQVLAKCRERIEALESRVSKLEAERNQAV